VMDPHAIRVNEQSSQMNWLLNHMIWMILFVSEIIGDFVDVKARNISYITLAKLETMSEGLS
jgi:hypothetical protein